MDTKQWGNPPAAIRRQTEPTSFQDLKDYIDREIKGLKKYVQDKCDQLHKNSQSTVESMANVMIKIDDKIEQITLDMEIKMKEFDLKLEEVDGKMQKMDDEITMVQFKSMESAIRPRGISEIAEEDIKRTCADALALLLKVHPDEIFSKIQRIFRVNSHLARSRQLPRDVVIYFTDRRLRDDILQMSFHATVRIDGIQIGVFKEIPSAMLKHRRELGFLTAELKRRQLQYRWGVPRGIIFWHEGVRYRLNTLDEAKGFLYTVLKISDIPLHTATDTRTSTPKQPDKGTEEQASQKQKGKRIIQGAVGGFQIDSLEFFPTSPLEALPKPDIKITPLCTYTSVNSTADMQKQPDRGTGEQAIQMSKEKRITQGPVGGFQIESLESFSTSSLESLSKPNISVTPLQTYTTVSAEAGWQNQFDKKKQWKFQPRRSKKNKGKK